MLLRPGVYHYTNRTHKIGLPIVSSGDFIDRHPARKQLELATRAAREGGEAIRADSLYVFEDIELARLAAARLGYPHIYEVTYEASDLEHRGDVNWLTSGEEALKAGDEGAAKAAIAGYWSGIADQDYSKPRFEILLKQAIIIRDMLKLSA